MADNLLIYGRQGSSATKRRILEITSWTVFTLLLVTYWTTTPWSVSYWDCPEYVTGACGLVPGHPPGNPFWMLVERVVTMFSFTGIQPAVLVNLSSGLFSAGAGFLMVRSLFAVLSYILTRRKGESIAVYLLAAGGAATGALAFGWCDSVWYSAVEAEVYAMSIFFTSLTVWLMVRYAFCKDKGEATRILVLTAYILGLSIGVHQLNLLAIPALTLIFAFRKGIRGFLRLTSILFLSLCAVGCILLGMMPSTIRLAGEAELLCVNGLHFPFLSGAVLYVVLLFVSGITAIALSVKSGNRVMLFLATLPFLFLSGFFIFGGRYLLGFIISVVVAAVMVYREKTARHLATLLMMAAMTLVGFSVYSVIMIRGGIHTPPNSALPDNPFSLLSYLGRDQYGSSPLLYGKTPYSKPLMEEDTDSSGKARYSRLLLTKLRPIYSPSGKGQALNPRKDLFNNEDSIFNAEAVASGSDAYVIDDYVVSPVYTPELDMWFPRITSSDPRDIKSFESWAGMRKDNMVKVRISETVDSAGNPVAKKDGSGVRQDKYGFRPTYLQSLVMFGGYQVGYMYMRYLMWNFSGRQNDISSTGEVEHGNFITGFPVIDNAMLGAEEALPPEAGRDNPGRNRYFMLPLLLGIIGMVWLYRRNREGKQTLTVITALFVMTGVAIVVYLNQSPGEPRERDYSFLGSFLAYAAWIGCGAVCLAIAISEIILGNASKRWKKNINGKAVALSIAAGFVPGFAVVALMFFQNHDDHDRSGRSVASDITANMLNSLDKDAILFVDGDNYTFPLWYAQEVEGIRRDVRVVNMAYLSMPRYAASVSLPWRDDKGVATTGSYEKIAHKAFFSVGFADSLRGDTVKATEMLRDLYSMEKPEIKCRYVSIPTDMGDSLVVDLKELARRDGYIPLMQRRLIMLDMIATNAESASPRPIYWQRSLSKRHYFAYLPAMSYDLLAHKWGKAASDSVIIGKAGMLRKPNGGKKDVYMDETPKSQISSQRAGVIVAGMKMLDNGNPEGALSMAQIADTVYGGPFPEYGNVVNSDTVFDVAVNLGNLYVNAGRAVGDSSAVDRGKEIIDKEIKRNERWTRYRRALPPRLRGMMRPR